MREKITITGMSCAHCAKRVEKALNAISGVSATVDLASGQAEIVSDSSIEFSAIEAAVAEAGYGVKR